MLNSALSYTELYLYDKLKVTSLIEVNRSNMQSQAACLGFSVESSIMFSTEMSCLF